MGSKYPAQDRQGAVASVSCPIHERPMGQRCGRSLNACQYRVALYLIQRRKEGAS